MTVTILPLVNWDESSFYIKLQLVTSVVFRPFEQEANRIGAVLDESCHVTPNPVRANLSKLQGQTKSGKKQIQTV